MILFCFLLHRVSLLQVRVFPLMAEHTFQNVPLATSKVHTNRRPDSYQTVPTLRQFLLLRPFVHRRCRGPSSHRASSVWREDRQDSDSLRSVLFSRQRIQLLPFRLFHLYKFHNRMSKAEFSVSRDFPLFLFLALLCDLILRSSL